MFSVAQKEIFSFLKKKSQSLRAKRLAKLVQQNAQKSGGLGSTSNRTRVSNITAEHLN